MKSATWLSDQVGRASSLALPALGRAPCPGRATSDALACPLMSHIVIFMAALDSTEPQVPLLAKTRWEEHLTVSHATLCHDLTICFSIYIEPGRCL